MKIVRDKYLEIHTSNQRELNTVKALLSNECIRVNPIWEKVASKGRFTTAGIRKHIQTFSNNKNVFKIYRANIEIYKKLMSLGLPLEAVLDERVDNYEDIVCHAKPRDEQQEKAIKELSSVFAEWGYGCLDAAPAAGKTAMACMMMGRLKQKTLVIVDMNLLVEQFIDSITTFTNVKEEEIGVIRGQVLEHGNDKKIIIATVQTLFTKPEIIDKLSKEIGFIVLDECHVMASDTFQKLLPKFKPKYQLGLSGSHERDDGMEFLIRESVGPIVCSLPRDEMVKSGSMVTPLLRPLFLLDDEKFYKYNKNDTVDFRTVVKEYYNCPKAISKIGKIVMHHYNSGDSQLLICKEKAMVEAYYEHLVESILGFSYIQACKDKIQCDIDLMYDELKKAEDTPLEEYATKTELSQLEKKKATKRSLLPKWKEKKGKAVAKINVRIEKELKKTWKDLDEVKNNPAFRSVEVLTGDISKSERTRIINETNAGKIKIIICTTTMDKAISISRLNVAYLLFSTRERANTIQRIGRVSRSFKGKTGAIVYDIIYDHYMSFAQFTNAAGDCRMTAHKKVTKMHRSINDFIWWCSCRFRDTGMPEWKLREFNENWYKKYVLNLNE